MVLLGDCIEVMKTLPDKSVDMILTDPPYGIDYSNIHINFSHLPRPRAHFEIQGDKTVPILWLEEAHRVLKNHKAIYIFCHWSKWCELARAVSEYYQKRISWLEPAIINSSYKGDTILDPFCGSGSTGVAAQKHGRKYILIDIDEQWIKVAKSRLEIKH